VAWGLAVVLLGTVSLSAEVRSSASYSVDAETFDGGGGLSTSASYSQEDSLEPLVAGTSDFASYRILHGFITGLTTVSLSEYDKWAQARALIDGVNTGFFDDPNQDRRPNIHHFAFGTDPLGNGSDEGRIALAVVEVGGLEYLTLTLPVRSGAVFSGIPLRSNVVDGISYEIQGDADLQDPWDQQVVEVVPALDAGLPVLGDFNGVAGGDWQYRTFRLGVPLSDSPRYFLRAEVSPEP
jgi:hypothetical protein